ncbi:winged helix-turn-helix domain-containing protein [Roseateles sp. PN1]|uniref:winged helix-turn-helix domain-containing protein n=1 Tax=Roseateles sp. PN1 TaxID=3137372 RepID=UPI00313A2D69
MSGGGSPTPGAEADLLAARALQIGEWQADPVLDELRRGEQLLKLEPRKMRLLMALARRPQQLVTLDQLLDEVWGDVVVTPSSVYQSISQLRQVLGDDASQPRYIVTVPRKGYRLVAEVSEVVAAATPAPLAGPTPTPTPAPLPPESEPKRRATDQGMAPPVLSASTIPPAPSRRLLLGGSAAAAAALLGAGGWWAWQRAARMPAGDITLAVLPFDDVSPKALEQPLADGLAESVIGALSRHQQIRVASRSTSFQFRSAQALAPQAKQLAVTHVLWGELQRWQQGLQLKLSLYRAADSEVLWHQVLESPAAALGRLAFSAANAALQALGVAPLPASASPMPQADAYELYLLGLHHQRSGQIEGILKARAYFQRAIDADPGFALAYVGHAATWIAEYHYGSGLSFRAMDARAQPLIDRALQLDPEAPLALGLQGHLKANLSQHEEARRWLTRAVEKAPSDASLLNWSGSNESDDGWPARAQPFFTKAAQLSPLTAQIQHRAGLAAIHAGQYEAAQAAYQRAIALAPQHANGHWGLGILGYARGRLADAVLGYRKALLLDPKREQLWKQLAWLYLDLGLSEEAQKAFAQFQALSATPVAARMQAAMQWVQANDSVALAEALRILPLKPAQLTAERDAVIDASLLHLLLGQKEAALKTLESVLGLVLADPVPLYNNWLCFQGQHIWLDVATIYSAAGQRDKAEPFIEQASGFIERYARQGNVWHATGYHRARIEALRGRPEPALAALEEAYQLGWRRGWWLAQDPALQSLRELPRFKAVLARIEQAKQAQRDKLLVA